MFATDSEFEDEVRRIARLLWPGAEYGGATITDGRERDGIFETDEMIHLVECTVSRAKAKAEGDGGKLAKLIRTLSGKNRSKAVKGWFVTRDEPTGMQKDAIKNLRTSIVALSFDQFRSKLVDARSYLEQRNKYALGSVRDPETESAQTDFEYVPLDIVSASTQMHSLDALVGDLKNGLDYVILGDYGAGKSSTMREIFLRLTRDFWENKTIVFPILLNLRDHHGQTDPTEALERHARRIGFANPSHLVRAWRAGYAMLLLDGFDEIAPAVWAERSQSLKDLRFRSMELVRRFLKETPPGIATVVSGRSHFFNSDRELRNALGNDRFICVTLQEFTEEQVAEYLRNRNWTEATPSWLPTRPLLLGYLAARGLLQEVCEVEIGSSPANGWHSLLDRISAREAEIEAGIDAATVRRILERLGTRARASADGLGPLSTELIRHAFTEVCGYAPDERGMVLLQRLPGLGRAGSEDDSRTFVDQDFGQVAQAGDVFRYIEDPFNEQELERVDPGTWQASLSSLGVEVLALRCHGAGFNEGKLATAALRASDTKHGDTLCADITLGMQELHFSYRDKPLFIRSVLIPDFSIEEKSGKLSSVCFQECLIQRLRIDGTIGADDLPRFHGCYFSAVEGRASKQDLPTAIFDSACVYDDFDATTSTTNAILQMGIPLGAKVLLTILRKLYVQRGSGRRELAFYRGLDHQAQRLVPDILALIKKHGFAVRTKLGEQVVWLPVRSAEVRRRANLIITAPNTVADLLVHECASID